MLLNEMACVAADSFHSQKFQTQAHHGWPVHLGVAPIHIRGSVNHDNQS